PTRVAQRDHLVIEAVGRCAEDRGWAFRPRLVKIDHLDRLVGVQLLHLRHALIDGRATRTGGGHIHAQNSHGYCFPERQIVLRSSYQIVTWLCVDTATDTIDRGTNHMQGRSSVCFRGLWLPRLTARRVPYVPRAGHRDYQSDPPS